MAGEKDFVGDLNRRQREAVMARGGPVLVLAGAGSGKTRVITRRVAQLLQEGILAQQVLALTFTNKAAREMAERLEVLVGQAAVKGMTLGTFHSVGLQILDKDGGLLGLPAHRSLMDPGDQQAALRQCLKELRLNPKGHDVWHLLEVISNARHAFTSPEALARQPGRKLTARVYKAYLAYKAAYGRLDFDDLILRPIELFQAHPEALKRWQSKFAHILVDEFQDTSFSQLEFIKLLGKEHHQVCAVGDDDQSIYGWRGARVENILNFSQSFPNAQSIALEQNYRSTGHILAAANQVISKNTARHEKLLWTADGMGHKVCSIRLPDERSEASWVAAKIQGLVHKEGFSYSDVGVLFRTGAQSEGVAHSLSFSQIPFRTNSAHDFLDRKEVKDLIAWLKLINRPSDWSSFMRAVAFPSRGVGPQSMERLVAYSRAHGLNVHQTLLQLDRVPGLGASVLKGLKSFRRVLMDAKDRLAESEDVPALIGWICEEIGARAALIRDPTEGPGGERRWKNLELLTEATRRLRRRKKVTKLKEILRLLALERQALTDEATADQVSLMTLHSAKGLEWPVVFFIGCEEGLIPHQRTLDEGADVSEERRLFYVGLTRARQRVFLTYAKRRLRGRRSVETEASRFLLDVTLEHREHTDLGIRGFEVDRSEAKRRFAALRALLDDPK